MNMPFGAPPTPPSTPPSPDGAAGARCPSPRSPALHVGIACSAETVLHEDNWSLLEAFTSAGHEARIVIWNDPAIRAWSAFDCVVVRTCWTLDVSTRDALLSWLRRVNEVCFKRPQTFMKTGKVKDMLCVNGNVPRNRKRCW